MILRWRRRKRTKLPVSSAWARCERVGLATAEDNWVGIWLRAMTPANAPSVTAVTEWVALSHTTAPLLTNMTLAMLTSKYPSGRHDTWKPRIRGRTLAAGNIAKETTTLHAADRHVAAANDSIEGWNMARAATTITTRRTPSVAN